MDIFYDVLYKDPSLALRMTFSYLFVSSLRFLVALLSVKLLTLGIIQVNLILHSLTRNIVSVGMTLTKEFWVNFYIIAIFIV